MESGPRVTLVREPARTALTRLPASQRAGHGTSWRRLGFGRKEKDMVRRNSRRAIAVAATAAVLVLAVTLLATRGVIDALLMIVIVAVLTSAYLLRRYARAVLVYRHSTPRRRHPDGEPVGSAPPAGRADTTGAGGTNAAHLGGPREPFVADRT